MKKWNIGWGTVSSCNMHCAFCYSKMRRKEENDLKYPDWIKFIDDNYQEIETINYGTGENTLDDEWFKLISYIRLKSPNIRQSLTTNGFLSEAIKDNYKCEDFIHSIDEVDVSLDFYDEKKHIVFRGQKNAYKWALKTLEICKKYKKQATIVFLGCKQTLFPKNIDGIFKIAQEYGAYIRMNLYRPTIGINDHSAKFIVDYQTIVDVISYINSKYHVVSIADALFSALLTGDERNDPSGVKSLRILPDGSITPSTYLISDNFTIANIKTNNVLSRLNSNLFRDLTDSVKIPSECADCVYRTICKGGVYDRRYLWHGTLDRKDPYCPCVFTKKLNPSISLDKGNFTSVHDNYLPTIFFKP